MVCLMTSPEFGRARYYKESEPIELWSATMPLPHIPFEVFRSTVVNLTRLNGERYTGFIHRDMDGFVTDFTRTRYPRKKYGVTTVAECVAGMWAMADAFDSMVVHDAKQHGIRVVMGLLEGYEEDAPRHSVAEVLHALPDASAEAADVFAVRRAESGVWVYTEPVAVISADSNALHDIYRLGDELRQERFTIEDFDVGKAYMVETRHCTEPD